MCGTLSHTAWHLETEQTLIIGSFPRDSATFPEKMVRHRWIEFCVQDPCQNFWDAEVCLSWNEKLVCFAKFLLAEGSRGSCCSFPCYFRSVQLHCSAQLQGTIGIVSEKCTPWNCAAHSLTAARGGPGAELSCFRTCPSKWFGMCAGLPVKSGL